MAYLVTEDCIRCKYQDCVEVCPVECFHEGANMLVIDPEECIDCGLCVPECEAEAIISDDDDDGARWLDLNTEYAVKWPLIAQKGPVPADADKYAGEKDKFEKYFDPQAPGVMRKSA
jgi:ferredoxin